LARIGAAGPDLKFLTGGFIRGTWLENGFFGVGASAPAAQLHVTDNIVEVARFESVAATGGFISLHDGSDARLQLGFGPTLNGAVGFDDAVIRYGASDNLVFSRDNAEVGRFDANGQFGIGTAAPAAALDIDGPTSALLPVLRLRGSRGGAQIELAPGDTTNGVVYAPLAGSSKFALVSNKQIVLCPETSDDSGNTNRRLEVGNTLIMAYTSNIQQYAPSATFTLRPTEDTQFARFQFRNAANGALGTIDGGGSLGNTIKFSANGGANERMRIADNGNVAIGTTTADERLRVSTSVANVARFVSTAAAGAYLQMQDTTTTVPPQIGALGNNLVFRTNNSEQARVDANGNFLMGTTSQQTSERLAVLDNSIAASFATTQASGTAGIVDFYNSTNTITARVQRDGVYNNISDYRAKEVFGPADAALEKLNSIPLYQGRMLGDDCPEKTLLIAHELQEVFPEVVRGEKDGKEMQGVGYSDLVPVLIKAVQELTDRLEMLEK
jgi:hypothetical protein